MSLGGENILSTRLEYYFPPGENILAGGREYSLPHRVESLPPIDHEKVSPDNTKDVLK